MAVIAFDSALVPKPPKILRRHVAAAVVGNALEFYDFSTYTYFATQIGQTFFPSHSAFASLMASLIAFGVGFVGRPIGAVVIGAYGDFAGRKPAMLLSFALMGAAIIGLAVTPSYAVIGVAAPAIVLILRLVQGFALGGDVGPTTAFLLEAAPPERRGFYCSLQYASQGLSTLLSGVVGVALSSVLGAAQLQSYGWRIAFLFGAIILPIGLIVRSSLPETLHHADETDDIPEADSAPSDHARTLLAGFVMLASTTMCFYVLSYMTTFASQTLHMRTSVAFGAAAAFGLANTLFSPLGGWLSDRFGRKPVMVGARVLLALAVVPAFMLLARDRDTWTLLAVAFGLGAFSQAASPSIVALTEALPRKIRSASLAIIYAVAISVFGGVTQPAVTWLLHVTGNLLTPAYYLFAANIVGIVAMLVMRETAPIILARRKRAERSA
jgi:MFS transporter, MHS family, citrate/tricarballylate:H+ symporter